MTECYPEKRDNTAICFTCLLLVEINSCTAIDAVVVPPFYS